jgi:small subunit ribosomal protein S16
MLAIRMQRTGRKGHAMFRLIVQDSRRTPTSGKVVAYLGSYDPHAKNLTINKEKASFYLDHGAQPSERIAKLLQIEGVPLPKWLTPAGTKERSVRHPDKRRSTAPAAAAEEAPAPAAETAVETASDAPAEAEAAAESVAAEETAAEVPAEPETAAPADEASDAEA